MAITNNNKATIDLPPFEVLQQFPFSTTTGTCSCTDKRGTHRYIYYIFGTSNFWRYDTQANTWQQLANTPAASNGVAGTCMVFDPTTPAVFLLLCTGAAVGWYKYTISTNAWSTLSSTNIPATFATDGSLCHTDPLYNGGTGGNDDLIYLIGNNATVVYLYTISTNSWATGTVTAITAAPGTGCEIMWVPTAAAGNLYVLRGAATSTVYVYNISGNSWSTLTYQPSTETFTTGTMACMRPSTSQFFIQKDVTQRIYSLDITATTLNPQATNYIAPTSTAIVGDRFDVIVSPDNLMFIYYGLHTANIFVRTPIWF